MKTAKKPSRKYYTFHPFTVRYAWIENNKEARAQSVIDSLTQESANAKFQKQNPHLLVVDSLELSGDPMFLVNLRIRLQELAMR
jgi:hypothetical protein